MSSRKRAIKKQKKQQSPAKRAKQTKKAYYASSAAKEKWEEKKARKETKQLNERATQGISVECPLMSWEKPSIKNCKGCKQKCSSVYQ